jgi:hypothetical protein
MRAFRIALCQSRIQGRERFRDPCRLDLKQGSKLHLPLVTGDMAEIETVKRLKAALQAYSSRRRRRSKMHLRFASA